MPRDDTRDLAIEAMTTIKSHIDTCERRYHEGNKRLESMFTYIKEAHESTGEQIEAATKQINDLQNTIAEARGAGKMAKWMGAAGAGLMGLLGGSVGSHLIK